MDNPTHINLHLILPKDKLTTLRIYNVTKPITLRLKTTFVDSPTGTVDKAKSPPTPKKVRFQASVESEDEGI